MLKKDFDKKLDELAAEKELNRQFLKKMEHLKKVIKDFEKEKRAIIEKSVNNENLLKHNLRKQKSDVKKLHATIWKQFNMADKNYFPDNFEILQIDQPDFNKLWSDVKYSR